ncbi:hypothetical protein EGR_04552 [Echinococcus granulosus]|uniref:Uncharacterized protein n=1 Tax=Echinococcus granulosus TaxID=6210 RepID=W6UHL2_ECHGR|nr:hypothetical protein EGR_04552 [Echinococcus granulosus]EUB60533.1 hypothetical protein EGR_04552 [Echinococcus granulosus]
MSWVRANVVYLFKNYPHLVYGIPLASACFGYSIYRHMCRRADGLERTFKYKNVYSVKRREDVVVTDENRDLFN